MNGTYIVYTSQRAPARCRGRESGDELQALVTGSVFVGFVGVYDSHIYIGEVESSIYVVQKYADSRKV